MGVINDFYFSLRYVPKPGMRRWYDECHRAWGSVFDWPETVRDLICDPVRDKVTW